MNSSNFTIFVAGDSTACRYSESEYPRDGWGQHISENLGKKVEVKNYAASGRSSKSFFDEGILDKIKNEIKSGDFLLIQFGHNDEKDYDKSRYTIWNSTFKDYLKKYIDAARNVNAVPILITPVCRRKFDDNGILIQTHGMYPQAISELAVAENVPLIDLCSLSFEFFQKLGPEQTKKIFLHLKPGENKNYPDGVEDNTHFCENGAIEIADLVRSELVKYL